MKHVVTRTGRVAYEEAGKGPPVLLLHAAGHDHHDFDAVRGVLARDHRTLALDWPAFGASDAPDPPSALSTSLVCDVLEDVVEGLGLEPAVLVGNSIGGTAAFRLAARRPERVRAVVGVDSGGFTPQGAVTRAFCSLQGRPWVRRWTGKAFARWYLRIRNPQTEAILRRFALSYRRPAHVAALAALWRSFSSPESGVFDEAARVRCPVLFVWGRRDPVLRADVDGRRAREAFPRASYVELDTGHVPFAEAPEAFLAALRPFLSELDAGRSPNGLYREPAA